MLLRLTFYWLPKSLFWEMSCASKLKIHSQSFHQSKLLSLLLSLRVARESLSAAANNIMRKGLF